MPLDPPNREIASVHLTQLRDAFEKAISNFRKALHQSEPAQPFDISSIKKAVATGVAKCKPHNRNANFLHGC